jgi:hypothetical protein
MRPLFTGHWRKRSALHRLGPPTESIDELAEIKRIGHGHSSRR